MTRFEISKTEGLIAATFTPFAADGSVDSGVVPRYAEHLHTQGVAGVFVNGTTGEGLSLSLAARAAHALLPLPHAVDERRERSDGRVPAPRSPARSPLANFGKERLAWLAGRVEEWRSRSLEI